MKLAAQYTRASMLVTVNILLIAGAIYYFAISYMANKQFDRDLTEEYAEMNGFIDQHGRFPKPFEFDSYQAKFEPIASYLAPRFTDTLINGPEGNKTIESRAIIATVTLNKTNYRMTIVESKEATKGLIQLIFIITAVLLGLLLLALFLTNRVLLKNLWQPFFRLLERLKTFSHTGKIARFEEPTLADEFRELQTAIGLMERKAGDEYHTLRTFTENASHEMMTPIAVITSKLDNLIQDERLNEEQLLQLQDIYNAGDKLSRLGQSLLLLVKINNQLIKERLPLQLDTLINDKISQFNEIAEKKSVTVTALLQPLVIQTSPYLVDILLNNLMGNALRHNKAYGHLRIDLDNKTLMIANTGAETPLDEEKIFERFQKSPASDGTGLGLTIAKNICDSYGWKLSYHFETPYHRFTVHF